MAQMRSDGRVRWSEVVMMAAFVYQLKKKLLLHLESDDSAQVAHNVLSSFRITADSPHVGGRFLHAVSAAFGDFFKPGGFYAGLRDLTAPLHLFSSISLLPLGLTAKMRQIIAEIGVVSKADRSEPGQGTVYLLVHLSASGDSHGEEHDSEFVELPPELCHCDFMIYVGWLNEQQR
ncbi:hypothetical protein HID58_078659 [Brassica napus]|uniref:Uncharacterized protein n=1 Tax=Brassica napus TaxID=3708 RepID=A0ABQ7YUM6_BRANA|nr:hypothetical protein HID58_078659 [Brassica napus]